MFRDLWRYRQFIISSIRNDLVNRFARSKLGGLWMIINPMAQVAIYTLILSNVLAAKIPGIDNKYAYAIYLMAGLLAWTLFSEIIGRSLTLFLDHANLLKKMRFPRITLPFIVAGSTLLNNIFLFAAILIIFLLLDQSFSFVIFWLIPLTLVLTGFAIGIGLLFGVVNVFLRDVGQLVPIVLQMWFWFTPIVYPETIIPQSYRHWLVFNPVYHFSSAYQDVLVYNRIPDVNSLLVITLLTISLLLLSLFIFRRANEEMADVL